MAPRNNAVFKSIQQEQIGKRLNQVYKYNYTYQVEAIVANGTTAPTFLTITQDADFMIEKVTGSCFGPVNDQGVPQISGATDFDMPGTTAGFAGRGLSMKITDTGSARDLTNGFIPVETILTPGYGIELYLPYTLRYFVRRNSRLRFDFRNQDTAASLSHSITIALNGFKYNMPEPELDLEPTRKLRDNAEVA